MKIVQAGEPVLRQKARGLTPAEIRSSEIQELIASMRQAMYEAPGVGLAAPQIGLGLQLAVIEDKLEYQKDTPPEILLERDRKPVPFQVIVNPRIQLHAAPPVEQFEGCLSLSGFIAVVGRAPRVTVNCLDHKGEERQIDASGWFARILQHEVDHLQGMLYIDRMHTRSFMNIEQYNRLWKQRPAEDIPELIGS